VVGPTGSSFANRRGGELWGSLGVTFGGSYLLACFWLFLSPGMEVVCLPSSCIGGMGPPGLLRPAVGVPSVTNLGLQLRERTRYATQPTRRAL
jgi:hypothetical protein